LPSDNSVEATNSPATLLITCVPQLLSSSLEEINEIVSSRSKQ